jgi:multidrug efflux pump subunit AcrA (membrane-fusion protein)
MNKVRALVLTVCAVAVSRPLYAQDVQWGPVQAGKQESDLRVPGHVIPQSGALSIESARVTGRITGILKREGEEVQVGDPLFNITSAECISLVSEMQVAKSKGLEDLLEGSHRREKELGVRAYEDHCDILATHSGTLIKRAVELGSVFNVGDNLATIVNVHHLTIELAVSEPDVPRIKVGQRARVHIGARASDWLETTVEQVLPTIDPVTRTTMVRLAPTAMPPGTTMDAFVVGVIEIGGSQYVLRVTPDAVVFSHNGRYVMKQTPQGPKAVSVELIGETDEEASIKPSNDADLKPGDNVAIHGAIFLFEHAESPN